MVSICSSAVLWLLNLGVKCTVWCLFIGAMVCTIIVVLASAGVEIYQDRMINMEPDYSPG